jgi:transcriptional regulator with XRE-family HTH domain
VANRQARAATDRFRPHSPAERAHPLVRRLFAEMNEQQCSQQTLSERSGINKNTFRSWRTKAVPRLDDLEACLNVLGLELTIQPTKEVRR